ncbi:hypothetical protein D3C85_1893540 [compost metagenome]
MDDRINVVLLENTVNERFITKIADAQLAADNRIAVALLQIIDHDDLFTAFCQRRYSMRADIARSPRY